MATLTTITTMQMPPHRPIRRGHSTRPMELLADAVGRPAYVAGLDPTVLMLIFLSTILRYDARRHGLWACCDCFRVSSDYQVWNQRDGYAWRKVSDIHWFATLVFGYIYGEFAGFEFLPHIETKYKSAEACSYVWQNGHCFKDAYDIPSWASWMTSLYPNDGRIHYVLEGPFSTTLAFPFHRVALVDNGGNPRASDTPNHISGSNTHPHRIINWIQRYSPVWKRTRRIRFDLRVL